MDQPLGKRSSIEFLENILIVDVLEQCYLRQYNSVIYIPSDSARQLYCCQTYHACQLLFRIRIRSHCLCSLFQQYITIPCQHLRTVYGWGARVAIDDGRESLPDRCEG